MTKEQNAFRKGVSWSVYDGSVQIFSASKLTIERSLVNLEILIYCRTVVLLIWLLYRRLRPYLQAARQVLRAFTGTLMLVTNQESALRPEGRSAPAQTCFRHTC